MNKLVVLSICAVLSASCSDQVDLNRELFNAIRADQLPIVKDKIGRGASINPDRWSHALETAIDTSISNRVINMEMCLFLLGKMTDMPKFFQQSSSFYFDPLLYSLIVLGNHRDEKEYSDLAEAILQRYIDLGRPYSIDPDFDDCYRYLEEKSSSFREILRRAAGQK